MEETNVTQPEVTEVQTETTTDTIDTTTESNGAQEDTVDNKALEESNGTEQAVADDGSQEKSEDDFELTVKYNKQTQNLGRQDATRYAQMGLKYEAMQPTLAKLQYLAAADNKTLEALVDGIVEGVESAKLEGFKQKANGDEEILNALIQADKQKGTKAYKDWQEAEAKALEREQQDEIRTLATEFNTLQKEVPEFQGKKFEDVPEEVLSIREKNDISLYDAYLRYEDKNRRLSKEAEQTQSQNASTSVGSVNDSGAQGKPSWEESLMQGIWG